MCVRVLFSLTLLLIISTCFGEVKDSNIVVSDSKELYEFIWQKSQNSVQVKQNLSTSYFCNDFRTTIPIAEFYDNETSIDNVDFIVDGKKPKDIKPRFSYYSVDDYFYSDEHICYFPLPLERKGSTSSVLFKKTISDPRYFLNVYFSESYPVLHKEVTIKVPRWMKVELKEINFNGYEITKTSNYDNNNDADVYTYTIKNLPPRENEDECPGPSYIYPHILVLSKEATVENVKKTYFNSVADQYAWYKQLVGNIGSNDAIVKVKAQEITAGITNDLDKIKAVFYWMQNNVRYVAFEDGIAGFKPDKADEVIRKKYGDCKGMANATKELLRSLGYDARLCWIGTNHIAYDYSTPSLSVDNHMICALKFQDKMYFLDATENYLGFDEYAERIQGRQVLIEDGDNYILANIPSTTYQQNLDEEKRILKIDGTDLKGTATHVWKGEEKEYVLSELNSIKKDKSIESFTKYLSLGNNDYVITDLKTSNLNNYDKDISAMYNIDHKNAVSSFDKEYYVDLDFTKELNDFIFDTTKRDLDFWFDYKMNLSKQTELEIPNGYSVTSLPPNVEITNPAYEFSISYSQANGKIIYKKNLSIKNIRISKSMFEQWNKDVQKLKASYNEQIVLTSK
jgi:transglutaminase-like putative cysteine protease